MITLQGQKNKKENVSVHHVTAGIYEVTVTDKNGVESVATVTENQLDNLSVAIREYVDI